MNSCVRDAAGLWWSSGESRYRLYLQAEAGWRQTVIENMSLWPMAPLLLAGGSAVISLFEPREPPQLGRTAVLSAFALTLGSMPFYVQCSPGIRFLGAIDILIGALLLAFTL